MAITDRITAYWSLGDATDASGNGHTLTAVDGPTHVTGKVGDGAEFNSTDESGYIIANASAAAFKPGTSSFSVAFWVKVAALPASGNGSLIHMGALSSGVPGWGIVFNNVSGNGQFSARLSSGTTLHQATTSAVYAVDTWYHVAAVYDRNGLLRLYIDGVQVAATNITASSAVDVQPTDDLKIGGQHGSSAFFDGIIDDVMFYDGCMSGDLMERHRNGTTGRSYADFIDFDGPYVSQEFITISTTNVATAITGVGDLVAGEIVTVIQEVDGNSTSPAITAWDGSWTQIVDEVATQFGTAFTRQRIWWKTVTATDVSTETQVETTWTNGQEFTQRVLMWGNCAGVLVDAANAGTTNTETRESPSIDTTGTDGCRILVVHGWDAAADLSSFDSALADGMTMGRNGSGSVVIWLGYEYQATGGATGTYPFTISATQSAIAATIAMEPLVTATDINPNNASVAVAGEATTITQVHQITPNAGAVTVAGQEATISQVHILTGADGSVTVTAQATTVTEGAILQPADGSVSVAATATTISQVHLLLPADGSVSVSAAVAAIIQNHVFTPTAGAVAVTVENATVVQIAPTTLGGAVSAMGAGIGARPAMGSGIGALSTLGN